MLGSQQSSRSESTGGGAVIRHQTEPFESSPRGGSSLMGLVLGFIVAFLLSSSIVIGGYFAFREPASSSRSSVEAARKDLFPRAFSLRPDGPQLMVEHNTAMNPVGDDFMLFVWFSLNGDLKGDQRTDILGKYTVQDGVESTGYGLSLVGGADGVRPNVYWRGKRGKPRWYQFASTQIKPDEWYLLVVTLHSKRYLGAHIARMGSGATPELLGGYDIGGELLPEGGAPLVVGAGGSRSIDGKIGAFGILRDVDVANDAQKFIKRLARSPWLGPDALESSQVVLWADPLTDIGPLKLNVEIRPH